MNKFVHKTIYREYLACAKNAWLKLHKKHELQDFFRLSAFEQGILDKGNLTESWAQRLFPQGILIDRHGNDAALLTQSHIEQKTPVLFQATFYHNKFLVRNDVLEYNETSGKWRLYEVKGKNSLEEKTDENDHIEDATFQAIVLKEQGIELEDIFIIHLNKDYVRMNDIDVNQLFTINNITDKVKEREPQTRIKMQQAKIDLLQTNQEALVCNCIYKGRSAHCKTFGYSHAYVPAVSVHDITRITQKKLASLINANILNIDDIPDNFDLTDIQENQVNAYKFKKLIFDSMAIKQELDKLVYPLYFLDYESYSSPIPLFNVFTPYQQLPFQFSLYVLTDADAEPVHFEYLHELNSDPSEIIIKTLMERIGPIGSIIVWHKSFEQKINNELGKRHPEYEAFLQNLNSRFFDLEEIFKKQHYVDAGFNGKTSIKNILPVLIPGLSYVTLRIQDGGSASEQWFAMLGANLTETEKNKIANDLRQYCRLDTYAMYRIWQYLLLNIDPIL
ncbi:MAG: DUF2779 domain-containing protein [Actinobacteria bacterium]|nr:DUF2779 domain-containing protein [Actinomycetota bacterium]